MNSAWAHMVLGDLCHFRAGSAFPRDEQGSTRGELPFIKVSDMNLPENSKRIHVANNWVDAEAADRLKLKPAPPGSVVFAKIGEALKAERLRQLVMPTVVDNNMMAAIPIDGKADPRYLLFLLEYVHLASWAEGSALPYLRQKDLVTIPVAVPPMAEQRGIAATLGALDDKIESNRRAIEAAERLGDALFAEAASGSAVLSEVATLTMGSSPPGSSYNESGHGLPFYQGIRDFGRRYPRRRVWTVEPVRRAQRNDTLVSVRAPVGALNRASEECCIGRGVAAVRSTHPSNLYYALRGAGDLWKPFQGEGTVFGAINKHDLAGAVIPWPGSGDVHRLETTLSALDAQIRSWSEETEVVASLRNALLPELLSGRLRVPEAAQPMEEAVT